MYIDYDSLRIVNSADCALNAGCRDNTSLSRPTKAIRPYKFASCKLSMTWCISDFSDAVSRVVAVISLRNVNMARDESEEPLAILCTASKTTDQFKWTSRCMADDTRTGWPTRTTSISLETGSCHTMQVLPPAPHHAACTRYQPARHDAGARTWAPDQPPSSVQSAERNAIWLCG